MSFFWYTCSLGRVHLNNHYWNVFIQTEYMCIDQCHDVILLLCQMVLKSLESVRKICMQILNSESLITCRMLTACQFASVTCSNTCMHHSDIDICIGDTLKTHDHSRRCLANWDYNIQFPSGLRLDYNVQFWSRAVDR